MQTSNSDVVQQAVDMTGAAHVEPHEDVSSELGDGFSTLMPLPLLRDAQKKALITVPAQAGGALWRHLSALEQQSWSFLPTVKQGGCFPPAS